MKSADEILNNINLLGKAGISYTDALNNTLSHFRDIPTMKSFTEKQLKQLSDSRKAGAESGEMVKALVDFAFAEVGRITTQFNEILEVEFKAVYDHEIANGIIKGKPTKTKFKKAGYDVCTQAGVGTYIRRNGERVSNIIPFPVI